VLGNVVDAKVGKHLIGFVWIVFEQPDFRRPIW
jgi:hypothetical protein